MIYNILKRAFDITLSAVCLILLMPLLLPVMLALRLTAEGEVFYRQKRIGLGNRYFYMWKFATMVKDSLNLGTGSITLRNDPRVTVVGRILRKTKINELPQLINVFTGDMSFVGPRPLVDDTFGAYTEEVRKVVYNSKPGITGIGSIIFRDEEKLISASSLPPKEFYTQNIAPYKGTLELWYQQNKSMTTDLLIIIITAWVILVPDSTIQYKIFPSLPKNSYFEEKVVA